MAKKRSRSAAARKGARPVHRCGVYLVAVTLLLLGVTVAASQVLWAGVTPEPAAAPVVSTAYPAANAEVVGNAPGGDDGAQTLNLYGGGMRPLVEERDGVQTLNIYGPGGQIIAQVVQDGQGSEEVRYLLTDHLGSTRVVVDAEGNAVARYEYAPHGETTAAGTAAGEVRYRYTGHPYDEGQEVYETPARGYDPTLGRFLSVDPQRETASPYTYVTNNPVLYKDPTGKGRVGTVVTPQVLSLAKELVAETSQFESTTWFMSSIKDPVVHHFFDRFAFIYDSDPRAFEHFVNRITGSNDARSLEVTFSDLQKAAPDLPIVDAEQGANISSNMEEFHRLFNRAIKYEAQRYKVFTEEFRSNSEAYFRSDRSMEVMKNTPGSDADPAKAYGTCGNIAMCIAGRLAETDPEVNVEVFWPTRDIVHDFVVVGRDPTTNASEPMTWNKDALIVDGWHGFVKSAEQVYAEGFKPESFDKGIPLELKLAFETGSGRARRPYELENITPLPRSFFTEPR